MRSLLLFVFVAFSAASADAKVEQLAAKTHELSGRLIQNLSGTWILQLNPDTRSSFDIVIQNGAKIISKSEKWIFKDKLVKMKLLIKSSCTQPCVAISRGKPDRLLSAAALRNYSGIIK